jgi:TldD protein
MINSHLNTSVNNLPTTLPISSINPLLIHMDSGMATLEKMKQIQQAGIAENVTFSDIFFEYSETEQWILEEGIIKTGQFSIDQGAGLRAVKGEKTAFSYTDILSADRLLSTADVLHVLNLSAKNNNTNTNTNNNNNNNIQKISVDLVNSNGSGNTNIYNNKNKNTINNNIIQTTQFFGTRQQKIDLLKAVDQYARTYHPNVKKVTVSLGHEQNFSLLLRCDGRIHEQGLPLIRLNVQVMVEENGKREQGSSGGGGRVGLEYFTLQTWQNYVHQAIDEALFALSAQPAPAGSFPVVLGAGWPGVLLHEAVGHGLEGDFNRKGSSLFSGKIGQQVAAKGVTVVDNGTIENRRGSYNFDDEGNPSQRTVLIEDGILKGYLQDEHNARLMNQAVTGNGRRQSFAHVPMPRMTNTYLEAGNYDPLEIIESVQDGIYATHFGGGQVDITNGQFVFSATQAWKIENGKKKYPIKGMTLIGNGPEVMKKITMLGNDLQLDQGVGVCGKAGQSVPVGVGQPTLKISDIIVGGTNG